MTEYDDVHAGDTQEDRWAIAEMWFRQGDNWKEKMALPTVERKAWLKAQRERWGPYYYRKLRSEGILCGEVASRWPVHLRTPDRDWAFYRDNSPEIKP